MGEENHSTLPASLPSWDPGRFDVAGDRALFERLNAEMNQQDETARPAHWWMLPDSYLTGAMEGMLEPWCGSVGQIPLSDPDRVAIQSGWPDLLARTWRFCNQIDHLGLLRGVSLESLGRRHWRVVDLFSVVDASLISAFCETNSGPRVLEIGGGFGRTAEFLSRCIYPTIRYVNVDAVPISLMYCYQYLRSKFPEKTVSILTADKNYDANLDFTIVPTWNISKLDHAVFDLLINIESFQEMNQEIVDFYLWLVDKMSQDGSYIYLINSRSYKFKGTFNFPQHWQCLYRHQSPYAWSDNHPTEIFRVGHQNAYANNRIRQAMFDQERSLRMKLAKLQQIVTSRRSETGSA